MFWFFTHRTVIVDVFLCETGLLVFLIYMFGWEKIKDFHHRAHRGKSGKKNLKKRT
jgi:hypothetical protein